MQWSVSALLDNIETMIEIQNEKMTAMHRVRLEELNKALDEIEQQFSSLWTSPSSEAKTEELTTEEKMLRVETLLAEACKLGEGYSRANITRGLKLMVEKNEAKSIAEPQLG